MSARARWRWGKCGALAALVLSSLVIAQERTPVNVTPPAPVSPQVAPGRSPAGWRLFEREIDFVTLIEMCARGLALHIEYDASKLEGKVALDRQGDYAPSELWSIFNRELMARSLTTVQPPGHDGVRVVPITDAINQSRVEAIDLRGARAGFVKVVIGTEYRAAESLVEPLKLMLSKSGGSITAVRESNALVIADYRPHVEQALGVLALLDLPDAAPVTVELPLAIDCGATWASGISTVTGAASGRSSSASTPSACSTCGR